MTYLNGQFGKASNISFSMHSFWLVYGIDYAVQNAAPSERGNHMVGGLNYL